MRTGRLESQVNQSNHRNNVRAGYEYVRDVDYFKIFRKRKYKPSRVYLWWAGWESNPTAFVVGGSNPTPRTTDKPSARTIQSQTPKKRLKNGTDTVFDV